MAKKTDFLGGLQAFWADAKPTLIRIGKWLYRLRSLVLAMPVAIAAVFLALRNLVVLPKDVGINLLTTGEYAFTVGKGIAALGPLAVTAMCLLLMFTSRRVVYPWLISVFSLTLPILIWLINVFPA